MLTHFDPAKKNIYDTSTVDWDFAKRKSLTDRRQGIKLTHTRASAATYFGADGLLKVAPVNLLLWSESFEQAAWSAIAATVTSNAVLAPDGTLTADKVTGSAGTAVKYIRQGYDTNTQGTYTWSVYLKAGTEQYAVIRLNDNGGSNDSLVRVDLVNGTLAAVANGGSNTGGSATITSVGNGWYRVALTTTFNAALTQLQSAVWLFGYTSISTTTDLYIWGAQLETGSTATDYIKTTSTINSAPRFTHDPITGESLGLLIEEQKTNYVPNSTMVGASVSPSTLPTGWGSYLSPAGITLSVVGVSNQNGMNYIDIRFQGTPSTTGEMSVFFGTVIAAALNQTFALSTYVSISAGTTTNISSVNLRIYQLNSGAYVRETATFIASGLRSTPTRFFATSTVGSGVNQVGTGMSIYAANTTTPIDITLRIAAPQFESGLTPTSVIPTTTAAVTRVADNVYSYLGKTNLCLQSETFGTTWTSSGASVGTNAINDPLGQLTADALIDTAVNETHYFNQSVGAQIPGLIYTFSCYMKKGSKNYGYLLLTPTTAWAVAGTNTVYFDLLNGAVYGSVPAGVTAAIVDAGNGWYRCSITMQCITTTSASIRLGSSLTGASETYTGAGDTAIYVWGAQFEVGRTATAYLATTSLIATDYNDSWFTAELGSCIADVYREQVVPSGEFPVVFDMRYSTFVMQMGYLIDTVASCYSFVGSVQAEMYPTINIEPATGVRYKRRKIGLKFAKNDYAMVANGDAISTDTSGDPSFSAAILTFGSVQGTSAHLNGTIRRLAFWRKPLPNSTLWGLTK